MVETLRNDGLIRKIYLCCGILSRRWHQETAACLLCAYLWVCFMPGPASRQQRLGCSGGELLHLGCLLVSPLIPGICLCACGPLVNFIRAEWCPSDWWKQEDEFLAIAAQYDYGQSAACFFQTPRPSRSRIAVPRWKTAGCSLWCLLYVFFRSGDDWRDHRSQESWDQPRQHRHTHSSKPWRPDNPFPAGRNQQYALQVHRYWVLIELLEGTSPFLECFRVKVLMPQRWENDHKYFFKALFQLQTGRQRRRDRTGNSQRCDQHLLYCFRAGGWHVTLTFPASVTSPA